MQLYFKNAILKSAILPKMQFCYKCNFAVGIYCAVAVGCAAGRACGVGSRTVTRVSTAHGKPYRKGRE